jgi:hypothetical protein
MQFVMFIKPDVEANGRSELSLESPFNEDELLSSNMSYIQKCMAEFGIKDVKLANVSEKNNKVPEEKKNQAGPGKPYLYIGA